MTLRDEALAVLRAPENHNWEVQGFGMLRTYLGGENEPRLQVWDQRLAVWQYSPIHDHPWDFTSTIIAGHLFNQRYLRGTWSSTGSVTSHDERFEEYNEATIVPGKDNDGTVHVGKCSLAKRPLEMYSAGDTYHQHWSELHQTRFAQGTVTVIERQRTRPDGDLASSIWQGEHEWVSARPRPAERIEIRTVLLDALGKWF